MSWQQHLDRSLINSGKVSQAAIFDLDGTELATSPSFDVSSTEVKDIIAGFDNPNVLYNSGVFVAGNKYNVVMGTDDRLIMGRRPGDSGVCIAKTKQCLVIGVYNEGIQSGSCAVAVETLAAFLLNEGY